jgi:hypothetical protein
VKIFSRKRTRSHRKANHRALTIVSRQPRTPAVVHATATLPMLPPGSMPQRTVELPKLPPRTAYLAPTPEVQESALRVAGSAHPRPSYEIDTNAPLFRDGTTWKDPETQRLERLRRLQHLDTAWPDRHGVNLGSDQSPKTLTFSTADYREFAGDGRQVKR